MTPKQLKNFQKKFQRAEGCWPWTGSTIPGGYGRFNMGGKLQLAHRVAYQLFLGDIPSGLVVRHRCDNPNCVNPEHLQLGTVQDNVNDREIRGRGNQAQGTIHGEAHANAKLTDAEVLQIRELLARKTSQRLIADRFNISQARVSHINTSKAGKHLQ